MAVLAPAQYATFFDRLDELAFLFYRLQDVQLNPELGWSVAREALTDELQGAATIAAKVPAAFSAFQQAHDTLKRNIIAWTEDAIRDVGAVLGESSTNLVSHLAALSAAMEEDSKSIRTRILEVDSNDLEADGSVKAHSGNTGTGIIVVKVDTESAAEQPVTVECTGNGTAGSEVFRLAGAQRANAATTLLRGFGSTNMTAALNTLSDSLLAAWSGSPAALSNWTLNTGTWGTEIEQEASTVLRGSYSLEGNPAGNYALSQTVVLLKDTWYAMGAWLRKATGATGNVHFEILNAAGTQAIATELDVDVAALSDSVWTCKWVIFKTGKENPQGYKFSIRSDNAATADHFIDLPQLTKLADLGGLLFGAFAGATDFAIGDKFGFGGAVLGINFQLQAAGTERTTDTSGCTHDTLVFTGADYTADFPVGNYIQHPVQRSWHKVTTSAYSADTTVTVAPPAHSEGTDWNNQTVVAKKEGLLQRFLGRIATAEGALALPSAASPTEDDPIS